MQNFCMVAEFSKVRPILTTAHDAEFLYRGKTVAADVVQFL